MTKVRGATPVDPHGAAPRHALRARAVLEGDDALFLVRGDGSLELVVAGMHPRPAGLSTEPVATRRVP